MIDTIELEQLECKERKLKERRRQQRLVYNNQVIVEEVSTMRTMMVTAIAKMKLTVTMKKSLQQEQKNGPGEDNILKLL